MAPGARRSRGEAGILRGTWCGAEDGRLIGRTAHVVTDEWPTYGWKLLEQGPRSQIASWVCCGGVSAVIGSSDLDGLTLVSGHAQGNQP